MSKDPTAKPTNNARLIYTFVRRIFPLVKQELQRWSALAEKSPDMPLAEQALASINSKGFHCQGGSIFALYPGTNYVNTVEFIVAYQTISDYLDNLVDSMPVEDEQSFAQLHLAMTDALDASGQTHDYYLYYPYKNDGGYLHTLVTTCQNKLANLPGYKLVKSSMIFSAKQYSTLQTYKHLALNEREDRMLNWLNSAVQDFPEITVWEYAAATGSTLNIFCLFAAAASPSLTAETAAKLNRAYFPWMGGLHILLDYFIDLAEDRATNQLNFVSYYRDTAETHARLRGFLAKCLQEAGQLPYANFHRAVVQGLLAMYLSDPKTIHKDINFTASQLIKDGGKTVQLLHRLCCGLRSHQII